MAMLARLGAWLTISRQLRNSLALSALPASKSVEYDTRRSLYHNNHRWPGESFYYHHPEESLEEAPKSGLIGINTFLTDREKLERGIWPWTRGVRSRLPDHYKQQWIELYSQEPKPVHYAKDERQYIVDEWGIRKKVENVPIPVLYNKQSDEGLWGGEGLVVGLRKKKNNPKKPRTPRIWKPKLHRRVFYSEILDKYMMINVTKRTLDLIDEAYGFDNYILQTHAVDLRSKLGMTLKREMFLALANETLHPNSPDRRREVLQKYKQFIIPAEEAEWVGLTILEAEEKQLKLEEDQRTASIRPLKVQYAEQLVEDIKANKISTDQEPSWWSKLSPFKEKPESKAT